MKQQQTTEANKKTTTTTANGLLPSSIKFISSCVKTVSTGVRSASASVASSISSDSEGRKDQVLWACFDRLELGPSTFKRVLLLGYTNGFQVLDVEDASNVNELVSRRDNPCTFLQMQPIPIKTDDHEGFRASHPLLLVVAGDETRSMDPLQSRIDGLVRDGSLESQMGSFVSSQTAVRFYSMRSHNYVHVLRFRSSVYMVRCSPRIIAVGLASQIYCFDALTLENKFSVLTYPVPQSVGQGVSGINIGYGPMDVGPRWLAYASNNPLLTNTGRLSPQSLTPSPGCSPSTSPSSGNLMARVAVESSRQLAAGLISLGDIGYRTLSKYCQERLPDGPSSPVTSNMGWKTGRAVAHETDNAGVVVIKDFVSRAVVSQFRAHTSPISALCFDPSETLLVTASMHGNNLNIFRIMPSCSQNGSGCQSYNWASSHVHLYKLHRGITSAVIQDICFSHYSQWVAVVSSKGTCHIYVISPFGSVSGLQVKNSHVNGHTLSPILTLPWWYSSSYTTNQLPFHVSPPTPVYISVVSRIRTGNSGWLNSVSSAASSAAGMISTPSGAISAVFHRSLSNSFQPGQTKISALEHLLVYSPSGHLIQYELLPSLGGESNETGSRNGSGSLVPVQDEELKVKSEPVQWWDVCRRTDWPEREECISGITLGRKDVSGLAIGSSDFEDGDDRAKESTKRQEKSRWYLSNAEVQMSYGRTLIWQKPKIYFYTMSPIASNAQKISEDYGGGEIEIEKIPHYEVEIRRRDLLPVFDHSYKVQTDWTDRGSVAGNYSSASEEKFSGDAMFIYSKLVYHDPEQGPTYGSSVSAGSALDSNQRDTPISYPSIDRTFTDKNVKRSSIVESPILTQGSLKSCNVSNSFDNSAMVISPSDKSSLVNSLSPPHEASFSAKKAILEEAQSSNSVGTSEGSNVSSNRSDFSMNLVDEGSAQDSIDFGQYFQEEYCKPLPLDDCRDMAEVVTDLDSSSSPRDKEKSEEDGESEDMLGGVFAFSEEG